MIDGDAYLPITTNPAYVTATMPDDGSSVFPTALVIDEASGVNWEGGAASFIDGLASDYSDMQVTLADGETPVAFGVEELVQIPGSRQLVVHLGIRSLSASVGTELLLWRGVGGGSYEDRSGVYSPDDGHLWYWPMNETSGDLADWTGNEYVGERQGDVIATQGVTGIGQSFEGGYFSIDDSAASTVQTWAGWVYNRNPTLYMMGSGSTILALGGPGGSYTIVVNGKIGGSGPVVTDRWMYVALTHICTSFFWDAIYGATTGVGGGAAWNLGIPTTVGRSSGTNAHDGKIDGVNISTVARSVDWLQTTAQHQWHNDLFWTVSAEQAPGPPPPAGRPAAARRPQIYRLGPRLVAGGILI